MEVGQGPNWGCSAKEKRELGRMYLKKPYLSVKKTELTTGGIRCADHATPSIRKSWH
jgi:hypothetical protein